MTSLALSMHHVGCAVESIDNALDHYGVLGFQKVSEIVEIKSQSVHVCFIEVGPKVYIELIQGIGDKSPVSSFLLKRQNYYHVCYCVPEVQSAITTLDYSGFRKLSVFESEAFNGSLCAFLFTPDLVLIELCQEGSFTLL